MAQTPFQRRAVRAKLAELLKEPLDRLADALAEDILNTSDEDILAEFRESGGDAARAAADMRALFETSVIAANKRRLAAAKAGVAASRRGTAGAFALRAPIDIAEARRRLHAALKSPAAGPKLTLAARKESELSDDDILGMIDDLEELGILPPGDESDGKS